MVKYFILIHLNFSICAFSQTDFKQFTGESVKTITPVRLVEPYFFEYRDSSYKPIWLRHINGYNQNNNLEELLLSSYCGIGNSISNFPKFNNNITDTTNRNGVLLIHKLTFMWQGAEISVVKFVEMKDSILGKPMSIQFQHIGTIWKTVNIPAIRYIENVILSIRTDIFWEIYMKKDSEIPGLNEVKKKVKDEEGFINMSFLSDFITKARSNDPVTYKMLCDN